MVEQNKGYKVKPLNAVIFEDRLAIKGLNQRLAAVERGQGAVNNATIGAQVDLLAEKLLYVRNEQFIGQGETNTLKDVAEKQEQRISDLEDLRNSGVKPQNQLDGSSEEWDADTIEDIPAEQYQPQENTTYTPSNMLTEIKPITSASLSEFTKYRPLNEIGWEQLNPGEIFGGFISGDYAKIFPQLVVADDNIVGAPNEFHPDIIEQARKRGLETALIELLDENTGKLHILWTNNVNNGRISEEEFKPGELVRHYLATDDNGLTKHTVSVL